MEEYKNIRRLSIKGEEKDVEEILRDLNNQFSSANINFLLGSGCSSKAIELCGNIEEEINKEQDVPKRNEKITKFKNSIIEPHKKIKGSSIQECIRNYTNFLILIKQILSERDNTTLPRKANIFTTNYDLFIEHASQDIPIVLNDGFDRRKPIFQNQFKYSWEIFFNRIFTTGNIYNYKYEVPVINLIKLHGSLSWKKIGNEQNIFFDESLNSDFQGVMPTDDKYSDTVMKPILYELFRFYSNELSRENTLLISSGFSFNDNHILNITKRQLQANPTLILLIFCYKKEEKEIFKKKFNDFQNVHIIYDKSNYIDFTDMINILNLMLYERVHNNG